MKIIDRYLLHEVLKPFIVVLVILAGLFASFSSARFLAEAVTESLGFAALLQLVLLRTLIALEVLMPVAIYVAVIIGLGRLYKDQEMAVLSAAGISRYRVIYVVMLLAFPVGIASGLLSVFARPWAYTASYLLDARAQAELNTDRFQAGRFYGDDNNGSVLYIQAKGRVNRDMENIFYYDSRDQGSQVIVAREARRLLLPGEKPQLKLSEGYIYELMPTGSNESTLKFREMVYSSGVDDEVGYKLKAAPTAALLKSDLPNEIAERQWRLSRPLATILLALLAIPFSRVSNRQAKGEKSLIAALIFAVYYNLSGLARTWVEQGTVPAIPGIWWLYVLIFLLVMRLLCPDIWRKVTTFR
ncbi:MAG: LPS export ABC transporter permease LptF [Pseudomonadales bacterium]|nr:LPS export ABC transporter permease LptF [Pseudomonadales bacterium]